MATVSPEDPLKKQKSPISSGSTTLILLSPLTQLSPHTTQGWCVHRDSCVHHRIHPQGNSIMAMKLVQSAEDS